MIYAHNELELISRQILLQNLQWIEWAMFIVKWLW